MLRIGIILRHWILKLKVNGGNFVDIRNLNELADMIARRDGISLTEANNVIEDCANEIYAAKSLDEVEEALSYWLGLEPDYLDLFIL